METENLVFIVQKYIFLLRFYGIFLLGYFCSQQSRVNKIFMCLLFFGMFVAHIQWRIQGGGSCARAPPPFWEEKKLKMSVLNNICAQIRGKRANFLMKWTKFAEKMVSKMSNFIKYLIKFSRAPSPFDEPPFQKFYIRHCLKRMQKV